MKKTKLIMVAVWVLILITLVISLFYQTGITGLTTVSNDPIKIGVILPLTGTSSDAAAYVKNGLELALEEINKKENYQLIYEDSQYNPKNAVTAFNKLINVDNVKYIIGAYGSSETLAIAPIAEENKVILITPSSQSDKISEAGDYVFRTQISSAQEADFFSGYINNLVGDKKINFLVINTDYGNSVIDQFSDRLKKLGTKIGLTEKFDPEETDFRTILLKFKESGSEYILLGASRKQGAEILKQAKELNLQFTFLATSTIQGKELLDIAGSFAEGLKFPYPYDDESTNKYQKQFREKYLEKYGHENEMLSASAYDALNILNICIKKGNNPDKVKDCLYNIKDYQGASGKFSFDENGDINKEFVIKTVKNGQFVKYE